jgi:hypothetical protein
MVDRKRYDIAASEATRWSMQQRAVTQMYCGIYAGR